MTSHDEATAFLLQAKADFQTYLQMNEAGRDVPVCHRLQFLQMAIEKLAKAAVARSAGTRVEHKHNPVQKWMGSLALGQYAGPLTGVPSARARKLRIVAITKALRDIERVNPTVGKSAGGVNCEYPWQAPNSSGDRWIAPVQYDFSEIMRIARDPHVSKFMKMYLDQFDAIHP